MNDLIEQFIDQRTIKESGNWRNVMRVEDVRKLLALSQPAMTAGSGETLTVWEGPMPESNGRSNFTAILMRKGGDFVDGHAIDRSEYPDRVRYEADRVRYLLGELKERPYILDYDADKHSGYIESAHPAPLPVQSAPEAVRAALIPFAEIGCWLFARNLPDDDPLVDVSLLNGARTALTRGDFKAAHTALQSLEAAPAVEADMVAVPRDALASVLGYYFGTTKMQPGTVTPAYEKLQAALNPTSAGSG